MFKQSLTCFVGAFVILFLNVIPNILTLGVVGAVCYRRHPIKIVRIEEENET